MADKPMRIIREDGKVVVEWVSVRHFSLNRSSYVQNEDYGCWYTDSKGEEWFELIHRRGDVVEYGIAPALCNQRIISGSTMVFCADWRDVTCEKCLLMGGAEEALA